MRFDALKETLLKAGIAPRHVRRYVRELDDHLADLTSAQREAGHDEETARLRAQALLGGDSELASAMLAQPGFKSLAARAPWLVFGLLPPLAMIPLLFFTVLPMALIKKLHETANTGVMFAPVWFQELAHATALFANFALGPGLAALLVWTGLRQRLDWKWPLLATAIIALAGFHMFARFPDIPGRGGQMGITALQVFRLLGHYPTTPASILAQFFLTLAPALWLLRDRKFARLTEPR